MKNSGRKRKWTAVLTAVVLAALALMVTGCRGGLSIVSDVRESQGYSQAQTMLLIANEKNRYESVYTDQIWSVEIDETGTTFQQYLLEQIRSFVTELKTMNMLADEQEIRLTAQDEEKIRQLAGRYYDSLTPEDLAYTGATEEDVYTMYEQYHRANILVDQLTEDINLEISDSEAKVIGVQEIQAESEEAAQQFYDQVTADGADFAAAARSFTGDSSYEKKVGRGERSGEYEDVVFALEEGQISPVFYAEGAWYVVKCTVGYDEEATLARKEQLSVQRKNLAFRRIYDAYVQEHPLTLKGDLWEQISFTGEDGSVTTTFFDQYWDAMEQ